jgi:hypothetical protein
MPGYRDILFAIRAILQRAGLEHFRNTHGLFENREWWLFLEEKAT